MTKSEAIEIFGGKAINLAHALKKGRSAISQWGEELNEDQVNMVIGAAIRHNKKIPPKYQRIDE